MIEFQEIIKIYNIQPVNRETNSYARYVPSVLKSYYSLLGHYKFNHIYNHLLTPDDFIDENGYTAFYIENQNVVHWSFKNNDLRNDPPVYQSCDKENFFLESASLSEFLTSMAYFQGLMGGLDYCDEYEINFYNSQIEKLKSLSTLKEKCTNPFMGMEYYEISPKTIIGVTKINDFYNILYGSSFENDYLEVEKMLAKCI